MEREGERRGHDQGQVVECTHGQGAARLLARTSAARRAAKAPGRVGARAAVLSKGTTTGRRRRTADANNSLKKPNNSNTHTHTCTL